MALPDPQRFHREASPSAISTDPCATTSPAPEPDGAVPSERSGADSRSHRPSTSRSNCHASGSAWASAVTVTRSPTWQGGLTAAPGRRQPAEEHVCATREAEKRQREALNPALQKVKDTLPIKACYVNTKDMAKLVCFCFCFFTGGREDC